MNKCLLLGITRAWPLTHGPCVTMRTLSQSVGQDAVHICIYMWYFELIFILIFHFSRSLSFLNSKFNVFNCSYGEMCFIPTCHWSVCSVVLLLSWFWFFSLQLLILECLYSRVSPIFALSSYLYCINNDPQWTYTPHLSIWYFAFIDSTDSKLNSSNCVRSLNVLCHWASSNIPTPIQSNPQKKAKQNKIFSHGVEQSATFHPCGH